MKLNVESWSAMAPGINTSESWQEWFDTSDEADVQDGAIDIKQIPPLLRRRFKVLGRVASSAMLAAQANEQHLPSIFASRHGDTELTLSLLQDIANGEQVSPTGFSLAVHNAIGGLLSIVRKDKSPMTAIASMNGLVMSALFEAHAQLSQYERVLCVIYDVPLPNLYKPYCSSLPFPLAVAFVLSRDERQGMRFVVSRGDGEKPMDDAADMLDMIKLLCGHENKVTLSANNKPWHLALGAEHA